MAKIVLISNSSSSCFHFRHELSTRLLQEGFEVIEVIGDTRFESTIKAWGVEVRIAPLETRSLNVAKLITYEKKLKEILISENPDVVFTFQTKPNICGMFASKAAHIKNTFAMVEGLGDGFGRHDIIGKIIECSLTLLFKMSLKYSKKVFFLNEEDVAFFSKKRIISPNKPVLIHGIGIDCDFYNKAPFENYFTATMISRLIPKKGVFDFCEAARECKKINPNLHFRLIGMPIEITEKELKPFMEDGSIEFLGGIDDVRPELSRMTISVVPTYYLEGLPQTIMEAMATGRPVITTKMRGCNFCVQDGVNGLFVEMQNPKDLSQKLLMLFSDPERIIKMGNSARDFAISNFDEAKINKKILATISANSVIS